MNKHFRIVVLIFGAALIGSALPVENDDLASFLITVQTTEHGISLTCPEGCSWDTLSWEGESPSLVQFFDQDGMTSRGDSEEHQFLISVQKTDGGISMTCEKGCAWLETAWGGITDDHVQYMNETGMTAPDGQ